MKPTLECYVKSHRNMPIYDSIENIFESPREPVELYIRGDKHTGKTTYAQSIANSEKQDEQTLFACSGADIALALQFGADDSFLEKLGSTQTLILDDPAPLLAANEGDQLLSLLLAERRRLGLNTIIFAEIPKSDARYALSQDSLADFRSEEFFPLDAAEKKQYVGILEKHYKCDGSPSIESEAADSIITLAQGDLAEAERIVRYLMTDEEARKTERFSAGDVESLISV